VFDVPHAIATLMADFGRPWAFCGGWAIDLFLYRQTREHKDVDIAVSRRDQLEIQAYLIERGWHLQVAHNGALTDWPRGEYLELPRHGIWCRHPSAKPDFLEMLLNEIDGLTFRFRRDPTITSAVEQAFIRAPNGLPILAPEIVLLYKSSSLDADNWSDFQAALPALSSARRGWLQGALAGMDAAHPWLADLEAPRTEESRDDE